jgi:acetyl esterase/lipase
MNSVLRVACALLFIGPFAAAHAQLSDAAKSAVLIEFKYSVSPNLTYGTASNQELKLDVYRPEGAKAATPVVMYIHGGGGVRGDKNKEVLSLLSYLEMGWAAVNVEYRLARVAPAPAAVTDCRCALRWIARNAKEYNFDVSKIVVTGGSTGGQLALLTAMVPVTAGLDNDCLWLDDPTWSTPVADQTPKSRRSSTGSASPTFPICSRARTPGPGCFPGLAFSPAARRSPSASLQSTMCGPGYHPH